MSDRNQEIDLGLIQCAKEGDNYSKEKLVKKYIPMVKHIVKTNRSSIVEFEDMFQEGLIGLISAIEQYNCEVYDVKFSSFAYLCIIRKIYNLIRQNNNYKNKSLNYAVSLHSYINDEENRTFMELFASDIVNPEEIIENKWTSNQIDHVLKNHLSEFEYIVIKLVLRGYSAGEIEKKTGIDAKSVDNARTRVRFKLGKIVSRYGSLTSSQIPQRVRKRKDLYMDVEELFNESLSMDVATQL